MPENHFSEAVAASYDDDSADMFQPSVVEPTVEFLAELAGDGAPWSWASAPAVSPSRRPNAASGYVWPAELDLMAQLAGLQLREPFTSDSPEHVSGWEKPG